MKVHADKSGGHAQRPNIIPGYACNIATWRASLNRLPINHAIDDWESPLVMSLPFLDHTERCILSKAAATRGHAEDRVLI